MSAPRGRKATPKATAAPKGKPKAGATGAKAARARRPGRRLAAGLAVSVALVGFLLVGVFPTQDWLSQRDERRAKQAELDAIEAEGKAYEERIAELKSPEEIERQAREEYGMIEPGETVFGILPPAAAPVDLPETWPFGGAEDWLNR